MGSASNSTQMRFAIPEGMQTLSVPREDIKDFASLRTGELSSERRRDDATSRVESVGAMQSEVMESSSQEATVVFALRDAEGRVMIS
jgi:hypothetical protein